VEYKTVGFEIESGLHKQNAIEILERVLQELKDEPEREDYHYEYAIRLETIQHSETLKYHSETLKYHLAKIKYEADNLC